MVQTFVGAAGMEVAWSAIRMSEMRTRQREGDPKMMWAYRAMIGLIVIYNMATHQFELAIIQLLIGIYIELVEMNNFARLKDIKEDSRP